MQKQPKSKQFDGSKGGHHMVGKINATLQFEKDWPGNRQ
jgi:hypothetical protein